MLEFDTLNYAKRLQRSGFSEEQATELAAVRFEIERLKDEVTTLKVGRPASEEDLRKLEWKLIPIEAVFSNWPVLLMVAVMLSVIIAAIFIRVVKG